MYAITPLSLNTVRFLYMYYIMKAKVTVDGATTPEIEVTNGLR